MVQQSWWNEAGQRRWNHMRVVQEIHENVYHAKMMHRFHRFFWHQDNFIFWFDFHKVLKSLFILSFAQQALRAHILMCRVWITSCAPVASSPTTLRSNYSFSPGPATANSLELSENPVENCQINRYGYFRALYLGSAPRFWLYTWLLPHWPMSLLPSEPWLSKEESTSTSFSEKSHLLVRIQAENSFFDCSRSAYSGTFCSMLTINTCRSVQISMHLHFQRFSLGIPSQSTYT